MRIAAAISAKPSAKPSASAGLLRAFRKWRFSAREFVCTICILKARLARATRNKIKLCAAALRVWLYKSGHRSCLRDSCLGSDSPGATLQRALSGEPHSKQPALSRVTKNRPWKSKSRRPSTHRRTYTLIFKITRARAGKQTNKHTDTNIHINTSTHNHTNKQTNKEN